MSLYQKYKNRRLFQKTFRIYFIFFLIIIIIFSGIVFQQYSRQKKDTYHKKNQNIGYRMAYSLDSKLSEIYNLATQLTYSPWLRRARSNQEIISNKVDIIAKQDVVRELSNYRSVLQIANRLEIHLPNQNTTINTRNWYDPGKYYDKSYTIQQHQCMVSAALKNNQFSLHSLEEILETPNPQGNILVTCSLDTMANPRAVLLITADGNAMTDWLSKTSGLDIFSVAVYQGELLLAEQSTAGFSSTEEMYTIEIPSDFGISYVFQWPASQGAGRMELAVLGVAASLLSLFVAALVAYFLAHISYQPIEKIMRHTGIQQPRNELSAIENAFDDLVNRKENMEESMLLYYTNARNSFYLNLLEGYFGDDLYQQTAFLKLPYTKESLLQVILLEYKSSKDTGDDIVKQFMVLQSFFGPLEIPYEIVSLSQGLVALLVDLTDTPFPQGLEDEGDTLENWLLLEEEAFVGLTMGDVGIGAAELSVSYQTAKEKMLPQRKDNAQSLPNVFSETLDYYYPTDWEVQLINALKLGKIKQTDNLLQQLQKENRRRGLDITLSYSLFYTICETIQRVIQELGLDISVDSPNFSQLPAEKQEPLQWEFLFQLTAKVCQRIVATEEEPQDLGEQLIQYVRTSYANPELSLKDLETTFHVSSSKIFRAFKDTANITFYDYLCRLRVEEAKKLFQSGTTSIKEVAHLVGYEYASSFSRAFSRYEGILPTDYIASLS